MTTKFQASVIQGKIEIHDKRAFREYMKKLDDQEVELTVEKWKD